MTEYPVQATRTSVRVIEALLDHREAGVTELAERLDLSKSAVHNHLTTLERLGFAISEGGRYRLGLRFLDVGMAVRENMELCRVGSPKVAALAEQTGELAVLAVREFGHAVYAVTESDRNDVPVRLGSRIPLHATAPGKAILGFSSRSAVDDYVETHGLVSWTRRTVTDRDALRDELRTVNDQGLAFDRGEAFDGMRSVAAPIRRTDEVVGAIAVAGPAQRLSGKRLEEDLPGLVLSHAKDVELDLAQ